jgi:hypothetical protein
MTLQLRILAGTAAFCLSVGSAGLGAQHSAAQSANSLLPPCFSTFESGQGWGYSKICISDRGNVVQFESPRFMNHLNGEGYIVCSAGGANGVVHGYDAAIDQGGFTAPVISQPNGQDTLPLTIRRATMDGVFELTQRFARDKAEHDVTVTMTVKNTSPSVRTGVLVQRYVNADANNRVLNRWAKSWDSIWAWNDDVDNGGGYGLMMTPLSPNYLNDRIPETFATWNPLGSYQYAKGCNGAGQSTPTEPADLVGRLSYGVGDMAPGVSRTVKLRYRRF